MLTFFLVCLLALRGLAGDAMAMGSLPTMATKATAHTSMAHSADHGSHHAQAAVAASELLALHHHSPEDSPRPMTYGDICAAADAATPACGEHNHGAPCAACVICHSAVSPTMLLPAMAGELPHAQPLSAPARFASAQPLQASKPPIS
ncbi:hypothetical protein [Comamonas sp. GB3 AK4-5]|uniref:hypothetical protein n=1 Tax=Comamonas sp. GB3 AK4-5 TaxID=3231487 RepID=UPI00351ED1BF